MRARRLIIVLGLMVWLLGGPLAIAFGGCVSMGTTCEGPCLLAAYALPAVLGLVALQAVEPLQGEPPVYLPTPGQKIPTPPPRSVPFSSLSPVMS